MADGITLCVDANGCGAPVLWLPGKQHSLKLSRREREQHRRAQSRPDAPRANSIFHGKSGR